MAKIYDTIIVGAGPAGLTAAKFLAANNQRVLVLEKNKVVGDKVCAGGLTLKDFEEATLPRFIAEREFNSANLYIGSHKVKLELEKPWIWTCSRKRLGKWQKEEAERFGAEILLNSEVVEIKNDSLLTDTGERFYFKYLIGTDGSISIVRKFLGIPIKKVLIAMEYFVPQNQHQFPELEVFFELNKFGPAYASIFPHQQYSWIGVCADPKILRTKKLKNNMDDWCRSKGINPQNFELKSAPINYDYQGVEFGNIFLVGDAAGLASGFTGEGMHPAMISGLEVARKIINPNYDFEELKKVLKWKRFEERILTLYKINKTVFLFF